MARVAAVWARRLAEWACAQACSSDSVKPGRCPGDRSWLNASAWAGSGGIMRISLVAVSRWGRPQCRLKRGKGRAASALAGLLARWAEPGIWHIPPFPDDVMGGMGISPSPRAVCPLYLRMGGIRTRAGRHSIHYEEDRMKLRNRAASAASLPLVVTVGLVAGANAATVNDLGVIGPEATTFGNSFGESDQHKFNDHYTFRIDDSSSGSGGIFELYLNLWGTDVESIKAKLKDVASWKIDSKFSNGFYVASLEPGLYDLKLS